ncbi:MAG: M24 family metallopeptidase [Hyphomicrobiaceae bacterium]
MGETRSGISRAEYEGRRARAAAAARTAGLKGLLVVSRGGGTLDRYGDVMYLTGFYTLFPYIPDLAGNWSARAHTFALLTAEGETRLIVDCAAEADVALDAGEIVRADLVVEAVIAEMRRLGLDEGPIGLVGEDVLPLGVYRQIAGALDRVDWRNGAPILASLRAVKSPAEIALLKRASALGSRMIDAMMARAEPGATHGDVVAAGMDVLVPARGMLYNSFMASGRGGDSPTVTRANFPTWGSPTPLAKGEWFRIGISGVLDGYFFDLSRSKPIGPPSNRQIDLFEAAISCVETGIAAVRPGTTAEAVAAAGLGRQAELGYPLTSVFSGLGHGVGLGWDSPWLAPGDLTVLAPGMSLCFERTVTKDGYLGDFEETVIVTGEGAEKITDARMRYW